MVEKYYEILQLTNEAEFLAMTCAQLRTKAKREKISHKRAGRNEQYLKVEEAQKKIGDDPIFRLKYDSDNYFAWQYQAPNGGRLDEISQALLTLINNGNIEDADGASIDGSTKITDDDIGGIGGGMYVDWQNKVKNFTTNLELTNFVLGFHQELELIANQKNEEKIKRQNVRKIQENVVFTIDLVKEEMEKKPNVKTRLDLDWQDKIKKPQQDFQNKWIEFQQAMERISEAGQGIIRQLTSWRTAEFNDIVNDHILSVEETLGNTGKRITEINDEEGIQTKMHPTTMKEEPVLNADGTPKKDGIFKKLGCPMGDCRAHKKGWDNWKQHMKEHLGTDTRNTWSFVELIRKELGYSSGPSLDQQRQDFIKNRLQKLNDWDTLDVPEKEKFWNKVSSSQPGEFDGILKEAIDLINKKKSGGGPNPPPPSPDIQARKDAINEIEKKLQEFNLKTFRDDIPITHDLKSLFGNLKGVVITNKKDDLLILINDYQTKRTTLIVDAVKLIEGELDKTGLKSQENTILGEYWKDLFNSYKNSEIDKEKQKLMTKISDFASQGQAAIDAAIQEIEKNLQDSNLPESVLGSNWKDNFKGKDQQGINVELEKLKKLIMAENDKTFGGKIKNQKIILDSRTSAIKKTKDSLKEGHKKLVVEESELPTELFAPYKTLEEKLNSLNKIEDITAFENNLLSKVAEKKKEKLSAIADEAIQTIKKELQGGDYELGQNKDFEKMIKGMIDPDDIERRKIILLDLIAEQKQAAQSDVVENTKKTKQEKPGTSWTKVIGITALVIVPLMVIGFIILRVRQWKLGRK